ncbi:MAG TPA: universal stress protein [Ktedonobacteraceae bacterium]|nr:universal stress protein [Ktedonobacteraceae bacterium]
MFQRILVPLDGSMRAERAIPIAARIARASSGSVVLARVVSKPSGLWPSVAPQTTLVQQILADDLAEAEGYLSVATRSPELQGVTTETVVRFGPTVSSILAVADSYQSDLIVLCSHGYTGITRRIMGSVAEKLAREAPVPVLVLREGGPIPGGAYADARPLRTLVPLDGSADAKAALEPAAHLIAALGGSAPGELHLVRVVQPVATSSDEGGMLTASQKARGYLSATAEHIREGLVAPAVAQYDLAVSWSVAVDSYVAETLVRTAENTEAVEDGSSAFADFDIIALATHGRDGWQRWVMGSVTEHILLGTKLPLLIVPPQGQRVAEAEEEDAETRQWSRSGVFSPA